MRRRPRRRRRRRRRWRRRGEAGKDLYTRDGIIRFVFVLRINRFGLNEKVRPSRSPLVISDDEIYTLRELESEMFI